MAAISNQLPYTPINPPAEPKNSYPVLSAIVQRVAFAVLIAGFSVAFGVAFSLSAHAACLLDAAVTSGIIGVIGSMPLLILGNHPTAIESYRQKCIAEIETGVSDPRALAALRNLREFFYYPLNRFRYYHEYALLYNEIAAVTDKLARISAPPHRNEYQGRPDVIQTWMGLLKHLHDKPVKLPGGEQIKLDFSFEFSRLEGKRENATSTWLTNRFAGPDKESLREIEAIAQLCVGRAERMSAESMAQTVANNRDCHIAVSRDAATQEIVGYGWYFQREQDVIEIAGLCRHPKYARMGIGSELLLLMLGSFSQKKEVQLFVRKSNPAMRLYQKWGFEQIETRSGYYTCDPKEDGILMKLDWDKYNERLSA